MVAEVGRPAPELVQRPQPPVDVPVPRIHPRRGRLEHAARRVRPPAADGARRRPARGEPPGGVAPTNTLLAPAGVDPALGDLSLPGGALGLVAVAATPTPPINPALLDALSQDFVASRFDARRLMRLIVTSA